ncbi:hypothetical protein DFJ74DRAFT_656067 [Hyaloraphidium curvatum]|nr:hypothetical protein DFJ74DRAFT_656067 [Hyaloraphidium curvatum]
MLPIKWRSQNPNEAAAAGSKRGGRRGRAGLERPTELAVGIAPADELAATQAAGELGVGCDLEEPGDRRRREPVGIRGEDGHAGLSGDPDRVNRVGCQGSGQEDGAGAVGAGGARAEVDLAGFKAARAALLQDDDGVGQQGVGRVVVLQVAVDVGEREHGDAHGSDRGHRRRDGLGRGLDGLGDQPGGGLGARGELRSGADAARPAVATVVVGADAGVDAVGAGLAQVAGEEGVHGCFGGGLLGGRGLLGHRALDDLGVGLDNLRLGNLGFGGLGQGALGELGHRGLDIARHEGHGAHERGAGHSPRDRLGALEGLDGCPGLVFCADDVPGSAAAAALGIANAFGTGGRFHPAVVVAVGRKALSRGRCGRGKQQDDGHGPEGQRGAGLHRGRICPGPVSVGSGKRAAGAVGHRSVCAVCRACGVDPATIHQAGARTAARKISP